jgi:hypothetical protein
MPGSRWRPDRRERLLLGGRDAAELGDEPASLRRRDRIGRADELGDVVVGRQHDRGRTNHFSRAADALVPEVIAGSGARRERHDLLDLYRRIDGETLQG